MAFIRSVIRGVGAHLPKRIMTNDDLARLVDTTDEWIRERTGIEQRHIAEEGELTSDLGIAASRQALVRAGIDPIDIDLIVCATSTPDRTFPATAVRIQAGLGVTKGAAFDVQAVCSGFVYALSIADNFLKTGQFKRAIVVGAETFSRILDWEDRGTCVLFGDGAGAVVLEAQTQRRQPRRPRHPGDPHPLGRPLRGPALRRRRPRLHQDHRASAHERARGVPPRRAEDLRRHRGDPGHDRLCAPTRSTSTCPTRPTSASSTASPSGSTSTPSKIVVTLAKHGNTSAASIPLALNQAFEDHRLTERRLVLMEAMGGGFTWGAALARW